MKAPRPTATGDVIVTYGFNVPCRRFLLTSHITRDRRLPVADEFILRMLKVTDRLDAGRLGAFFGFSPTETATVLQDLQTKKHIVLSGDVVQLAPAAHELFRIGLNGLPHILELETWVDRIWFDLISRNMVPHDRTRQIEHLISLKPSPDEKALPTAFARAAFEQNFKEYLRKVRGFNNPDAVALYSVSDVAADRYGTVVSFGAMDLQLDPEPRLNPRLLKVELEDLARYRPLHDAMHDAVRGLTHPEPSQAGHVEFRRLTGDTTVAAHGQSGQYFQLSTWLADPKTSATPNRTAVFGASYTGRNSEALQRGIEREALRRFRTATPRSLDLYWFRPVGNAWGASPDLPRVVKELAGLLKHQLAQPWEVRTNLVTPAITKNETRRRFRRVFDRGLAAPVAYLTTGTEIIYLRGVAALVLTQVQLSRTVSVPVGFVLTGEADLRRLEQALKLEGLEREAEMIWSPSRADTAADELTEDGA